MIMSKIILRENVENNNNQLYPANGLTIIIPTVVLRNCYYSLMKSIQSFVSHCSTEYIYIRITDPGQAKTYNTIL